MLTYSQDTQHVSSQLAPAFALRFISVMIQNENDKHMSELTLRRQLIYRLIEMLHVTSMQSFQRQRLTFRKHTQLHSVPLRTRSLFQPG